MVESITGGSLQAMIRIFAAVIVMSAIVFTEGPWQLALFLFFVFPAMMGFMGTVLNVVAVRSRTRLHDTSDHIAASRSRSATGRY